MVDDIRMPNKRPGTAMGPENTQDEPIFKAPERVEDDVIDMNDPKVDNPSGAVIDGKPPKKPRTSPFVALKGWWDGRSKKQKIGITIGGIVLVILICVGIVFAFVHDKKPVTKTAQKTEAKKEAPKPATVTSELTGLPVSPDAKLLPVTGVMIENSPDARPQAGLKDAGVVFEAIAEAGITRFLALYQEAQPDYIGPIRSVRPYYVSWLEGFDAAIAHVGGSPDGLAKVKADGVKDLDQFYNGGSYQRVNTRYAPHNVYSSLGNLIALQKAKGFSSTFTGFPRKAEKPLTTPTAKSIDFSISGPLYNPHYDYDTATNSYKRSEGGKPHVNDRDGVQISPKVVIAIVMNQGLMSDGLHSTYDTVGSGKAYIFQDGGVTVGTWSKDADKSQIHFGDANGSPIGLNPGQTWISAVGSASYVTYSP